MHGHDPHLVPALLEVSLDFRAPVLDPVQEALERGRVRVAVGERECQELLDGVSRFRAEAAEQRRPPAARAQHLAVELEGRHPVGGAAKGNERLVRRGERGGLLATPGERCPQARVASIVCEREQRLLVEPDQRALEHRGKGQVVARQQAELAERDQVHDRELLGQHHAVDPRHRHAHAP